MGNNPTKESRGPESPLISQRHPDSTGGASGPTSPTERPTVYTSRNGRGSRPDLSFLGIGSSSHTSEVPERRETKQEREARKLEKERVARVKERERSLKEEHIDGGYLVTMGVYTGPEDFNKAIVRQLMIERRIAPFWRGLDDFKEEWTEHQLVAAGRGLPIPAPDEVPDELLLSPLADSPHASNQNLQNLTVPISSRSHSVGSDASATLSPSHPAFASQPTSPATPPPGQSSSPFRPRSKTLASLTNAAKNIPSSEIVPREIQLPRDPFVNGQAIEVFLYKDAAECPICFLFYPPYLNRTRCCDQSICSECFVQIKRPEPHPPEHHDPSNPPPVETPAEAEASLVSEPACCPYCQQPEFGVTYDPPPFRRGLAYANAPILGSFASAMSSSSSLNSASGPTLVPHTHKRRTTSISANASTVITTDRVRPDWNTKLQNARNHLARRSAAATALHTAAYLMGNGTADTRSFGFASRSRFGRNRHESSPGASGTATPSPTTAEPATPRTVSEQISLMRREAQENGGTRRRSRMDDLEDMMMMEAIRLSLAAEEERKKKAEKEAAKEAKKKAKEEKKREKKEKKGVYGSGASSANGSALSLLPGIGRRRGNSGASNLQREVMPEDAETPDTKGKAVDRGISASPSTPIDFHRSNSGSSGIPGARHLDTATLATISDLHQPSSSPTIPERPSHLRHMSNASSPASSFVESTPGSLRNDFQTHGSSSTLDSPNASGTNLLSSTDNTDDGDANGSAGPESMFNFQSLAAMIGEDGKEDQEDAAKHIEHLGECGQSSRNASRDESTEMDESVATLRVDNIKHHLANGEGGIAKQATPQDPQRTTPELMITPETPAASNHGDEDGKQLGAGWTAEVAREITQ
ncbi:hypothetical protein EG329_009286 [Mollisiaceae sp. DMI_Dod_QoI]|nr:hypothetical protein EG329_009286 [Helotiales sp. DMI_Dod_QoI]